MSSSTKTLSSDPRDVARAALLQVEEQLALANCSAAILEPWAALVAALALGPAPELRDCPSCGKAGMRAATRCGYCWLALIPPGVAPTDVAPKSVR
jgi:hypothetical protein